VEVAGVASLGNGPESIHTRTKNKRLIRRRGDLYMNSIIAILTKAA